MKGPSPAISLLRLKRGGCCVSNVPYLLTKRSCRSSLSGDGDGGVVIGPRLRFGVGLALLRNPNKIRAGNMACTLIEENLRGHLRQAVPCKGLKQIVLVPPPRLGFADGGGFGNEVAPVHATRAHFVPSAPHRRPYARCDARHHCRLLARSGDVFGAGRHDFSRESKRDRGPFTRGF